MAHFGLSLSCTPPRGPNLTITMKRNSALLAGILAGLTSPAMVGTAGDYPRLAGSDLGRMRSDVARVGRDFEIVIHRKNGEKPNPTARKAA